MKPTLRPAWRAVFRMLCPLHLSSLVRAVRLLILSVFYMCVCLCVEFFQGHAFLLGRGRSRGAGWAPNRSGVNDKLLLDFSLPIMQLL